MTQTETAESTPLRSAERPQGLQGGSVGAKGEAPCVARPTTPTGGRECLNPIVAHISLSCCVAAEHPAESAIYTGTDTSRLHRAATGQCNGWEHERQKYCRRGHEAVKGIAYGADGVDNLKDVVMIDDAV